MKKYIAIVIALIMMLQVAAFADDEIIEVEETVEEVVEEVIEEVEEEVVEETEEVVEEASEEVVETEETEETEEEVIIEAAEETEEEVIAEETEEETIEVVEETEKVEEEKVYTVRFVSDHDGETVEIGEIITLTAIVEGLEDTEYTIRWEYSDDNGETAHTAGNGTSYSFAASEENVNYLWRVVVEIEG